MSKVAETLKGIKYQGGLPSKWDSRASTESEEVVHGIHFVLLSTHFLFRLHVVLYHTQEKGQ